MSDLPCQVLPLGLHDSLSKDILSRQVKELTRRYTSLLANLRLPAFACDFQANIEFINDHFLEITGLSRDDTLHQNWIQTLIPDEYREKNLCIFEANIEGQEEILYYETKIKIKNGQKYCGFNATLHRNEFGQLIGLSYIGQLLNDPPEEPCESQEMIGDYYVIESKSNLKIGVNRYTKERVAIKVLEKKNMTEVELQRARREIEIMTKLSETRHPNITKLLYSQETEHCFYLVQEYIPHGELLTYILKNKKLCEEEAHQFFLQILSAIECCHSNKIVHRDIKHQNILLDSTNNIKLIDFGFSSFLEEGTPQTTFCGTPAYAAPEILLGKPYDAAKADMWSLGIVLYSMLVGDFPFKSLIQIMTGNYPEPEFVSEECKDLLRGLLTIDSRSRISLDEVRKHRWVCNLNTIESAKRILDSLFQQPNPENSKRVKRDHHNQHYQGM